MILPKALYPTTPTSARKTTPAYRHRRTLMEDEVDIEGADVVVVGSEDAVDRGVVGSLLPDRLVLRVWLRDMLFWTMFD